MVKQQNVFIRPTRHVVGAQNSLLFQINERLGVYLGANICPLDPEGLGVNHFVRNRGKRGLPRIVLAILTMDAVVPIAIQQFRLGGYPFQGGTGDTGPQ